MDRVERQILWLPVVAGTVLGVNGMVGFFISDSQSVLLDGLLSLSYVMVGLVTVWAGHLVTTPNAKYLKGRSGAEAIVNIFKSPARRPRWLGQGWPVGPSHSDAQRP